MALFRSRHCWSARTSRQMNFLVSSTKPFSLRPFLFVERSCKLEYSWWALSPCGVAPVVCKSSWILFFGVLYEGFYWADKYGSPLTCGVCWICLLTEFLVASCFRARCAPPPAAPCPYANSCAPSFTPPAPSYCAPTGCPLAWGFRDDLCNLYIYPCPSTSPPAYLSSAIPSALLMPFLFMSL